MSVEDPLPPPDLRIAPMVRCPNCNHGINSHAVLSRTPCCASPGCECLWSPNDVAIALLEPDLISSPSS